VIVSHNEPGNIAITPSPSFAGTITRGGRPAAAILLRSPSGTDGSNPLPSTSESDANPGGNFLAAGDG
jgi:hypothetical protein